VSAPAELPSTGSTLVGIAALHVFLATNPHLAIEGLRWSVEEPEGITGMLPSGHPGTATIAAQVAALVGTEVREGTPHTTKDGSNRQPYYVHGRLGGLEFFFSGCTITPEAGVL
jgi:hypothetical protein